MTDPWGNELFGGVCNYFENTLYGCCCPSCALASVKSSYDGSSWCFNCLCFSVSPHLVRNYIRVGYNIEGSYGCGDCCMSYLCKQCVVVQLLNEVKLRGPKIVSLATESEAPWKSQTKDAIFFDDCINGVCIVSR